MSDDKRYIHYMRKSKGRGESIYGRRVGLIIIVIIIILPTKHPTPTKKPHILNRGKQRKEKRKEKKRKERKNDEKTYKNASVKTNKNATYNERLSVVIKINNHLHNRNP